MTREMGVPTSYLVARLLPYLLLLNVAELVFKRSDASDALRAALAFVVGNGLLVFAGYQANVLGGTRGQAMWSAWWLSLIGVGLSVLESLLGLNPIPDMPLPTTITVNTLLSVIAIITVVLAILTLVMCWLLTGFGYWIAGGDA
jgi:hypothetical protein